ncbi:unnamed protein product, partial [marine sediment metagenome]
ALVSISGDLAIVGAFGNDDAGGNSGSAYVYERDGDAWTLAEKFTASDASNGDLFGQSVSISGDYAIVTSRHDDDDGHGSGSAYVFYRYPSGDWVEDQKLTASDAEACGRFGSSASISGDYAIVGAIYDDGLGSGYGLNGLGSAYIFHLDGSSWVEHDKVSAYDEKTTDYFAQSVSIDGEYAFVGAERHSYVGLYYDVGTAYVYVVPGGNVGAAPHARDDAITV